MARKKAMDYQTRALRLHLGAPKLGRGRQNVDIQTDNHLEEVRTAFVKFTLTKNYVDVDKGIYIPSVLARYFSVAY